MYSYSDVLSPQGSFVDIEETIHIFSYFDTQFAHLSYLDFLLFMITFSLFWIMFNSHY